MTRHLPHWAKIYMLGSEHIFGVCVVTCDTWHSAISFDLVQGNMLVSQGKVLSPGNEGFMVVNVYVYLFPQLCFICVHMPISGLSSLVQFLYMPATVGRPVCSTEARIVEWIANRVIAAFVGSDCCSGLKEDCIFDFLYFWILDPGI